MRILIVTDKMGLGGAETHIYTLISELKKKGIPTALLSCGGAFADKLSGLGIKCYKAPLDKRDPISVIRSKRILASLMKESEIVHTHTRFTTFLAMKIRGKATFPTIVSTAHLCFQLSPLTKGLRWGDGTLAVSDDIKRYLTDSYGVRDENIRITRNGIDTDYFDGTRTDAPFIVHTSRLDSDRCKCAFLLCEIAGNIHELFPDVKILIVGDGEKFEAIKSLCQSINSDIGSEVLLAMGGTSDVKGALMQGAVFVGVSRSALEAMAMGFPTVICGNEGYAGVVTEDKLERLILTNFCARGERYATKEVLLSDILSLLSDKERRDKLSAFSRNAILRYFQSSIIAKDALYMYKKYYKPPRLCLLGYFGFSNLGDEEILKSAELALMESGISEISVLKKSNGKAEGINIYNRASLTQIHKALSSCDILVLCGGNLLQNETSLRSLIYYSALGFYSKFLRKRLYILSSGIGEIKGAAARTIVSRCVKSASFIGARTRADKALFYTFSKSDKQISVMPDFCFLLPKRTHTGRNIYFAIIAASTAFLKSIDVKTIIKETGLTPIGIVLCAPLDEKRVKGIYSELEIDCYAPKDFSELASLLVKCAFTLSERLHGAIFSVISHTPAYLSDKSSKSKAFIDELSHRAKALGTEQVVLPISERKKKIGAKSSDFDALIDSLREDIYIALKTVFGTFYASDNEEQ